MEYTFVLTDKGSKYQSWWLKISTTEQLLDYLAQTNPTRYKHVLENYLYGKEFNPHETSHAPHINETGLTYAMTLNATDKSILTLINDYSTDVAIQQQQFINEYGYILVNTNGGYHPDFNGPVTYDFIKRKSLTFPCFKKDEIKIKQFPNGTHFYAYIDNIQVRDGDVLKWNTYEEAYQHALAYVTNH